jgi:hypothetical protein
MSDELLKSKHLLKYWGLVGVYVVLAAAFVWVSDDKNRWPENTLLGALVLGPAFSYPIAFYWNKTSEERRFVKQLSEMWGPAWAALSVLWIAIAKGGW